MELRDITIFVRVAEEGNLSAAARRLLLAPSSVSKAITRLEHWLGRQLIHRSSRSTRLTLEGQHFLEAAYHVIDAMQEAEDIGSALPAGALRIRSVPTFARYQLAPLMPALHRTYPRLRIEFVLSNERTAWLDDGSDIAIVSGSLPSSSLVARRIASSRWIICAAPAYLATKGYPSSLEALGQHECLNFSMPTRWNQWSDVDKSTNTAIPFTANHGDMLLALAKAGAGIVKLAEYHISDELRAGHLVALFPEQQDETEEPIYALYKSRQYQSPRVHAFLDFLDDNFAEPPWRTKHTLRNH